MHSPVKHEPITVVGNENIQNLTLYARVSGMKLFG